ncbi:hypothetical protein POM88_037493 [Heracleum sosnowskyi]|uniref:Uncharacterized protein n=1 Tax=Heracleum sosnowskyi TaxID=360622 RepID=A0AAD8MFD1_9APIA|nr:hypothetical protein POM88_037493 [Heracleum sosnowskyi]
MLAALNSQTKKKAPRVHLNEYYADCDNEADPSSNVASDMGSNSIKWENEWVNVDGDLVHPNEDLWWADVDRAVGASRSVRARNSRSTRRREDSSSIDLDEDEETNEDETRDEDLDPILEDEDIEDDYGMGSDPDQYSDHE